MGLLFDEEGEFLSVYHAQKDAISNPACFTLSIKSSYTALNFDKAKTVLLKRSDLTC